MNGKIGATLAQATAVARKFYGHRPKMRGWIHAASTPLSLIASIVMVCLAPPGKVAIGCGVFLVCSLLLFGVSAIYHLVDWKSFQAFSIMRRIDHCNIFLLIAGSYTPISLALLNNYQAKVLLIAVWGGSLAGVLMSIFWFQAPRYFYVPIYILVGWMAIWYMQSLATNGGWAVVILLIAGGLCYSIGAIFYALHWPGRKARYFGFHEFFHTGTVAGWTCICIAGYFAILNPAAGTF